MKKTIFDGINSLDDIQRHKKSLKKKAGEIEKTLSEKTSFAQLLLNTGDRLSDTLGEKDGVAEIAGYLLPLGIKYFKKIKKNTSKKQLKKILIYSSVGILTAFVVYQFVSHRKTEKE